MSATPYAVVRAINLFPRTFVEVWLASIFVLTRGDLSLLTSSYVKSAYCTAVGTALGFAVCCVLIKRITLLSAVFLTGSLAFFFDLFNHTSHGVMSFPQALATGVFAGTWALIFDVVIARIRSN